MSPLDVALALVLTLVGGALSAVAAVASRHVRRVLREKTSTIAELVTGPAEIVGQLRARTPVLALDGSPAVALRWAITATYEQDGDSTTATIVHNLCSVAEVIDETGVCALSLDRFVLLGPRTIHQLSGPDLAARYPELVSRLPACEERQSLARVHVEETRAPDGVRGFVSGEAVLDDAPGEPTGYRDGKRRFKLRGTDDRPLIVSGWCQRQVVRTLLRPVLRVALLGAITFVLAALAACVPSYLRARSGL